ncbi:hypothetical protein RI367_002402 [Sorochytrium milnesiophthora]
MNHATRTTSPQPEKSSTSRRESLTATKIQKSAENNIREQHNRLLSVSVPGQLNAGLKIPSQSSLRSWLSTFTSKQRVVELLVLFAVFAVGIGLSCLLLWELKLRPIQQDVQDMCADQQNSLSVLFNKDVLDLLATAEAYIINRPNLTLAEFQRFFSKTALNRNYISGIGVFQHVPASHRSEWEQYHASSINQKVNGVLVSDINRTDYWPNLYSYNPTPTSLISGFNPTSEQIRSQAINRTYTAWQQQQLLQLDIPNPSLVNITQPSLTPPVGLVSYASRWGYTLWHAFSDPSVQIAGPYDIPNELLLNVVFYTTILQQTPQSSSAPSDLSLGYRLYDVSPGVTASGIQPTLNGSGYTLNPYDQPGHRFLEQNMPSNLKMLEEFAIKTQVSVLDRTWELQCIPAVPAFEFRYDVVPYIGFAIGVGIVFICMHLAYRLVRRLHHANVVNEQLLVSRKLFETLKTRSQACVAAIPNPMLLLNSAGFVVGLNEHAASLVNNERPSAKAHIRDIIISNQQCAHAEQAHIDEDGNMICYSCRDRLCSGTDLLLSPTASMFHRRSSLGSPVLLRPCQWDGAASAPKWTVSGAPMQARHSDGVNSQGSVMTGNREVLVRKSDGSCYVADCSVSQPVEGKHASSVQVILLRDLTEKKQTLGKLQRAKSAVKRANRLKAQMLLLLSHELRNPNYVISSTAKMIYENPAMQGVEEDLKAIMLSSEHMQRLVDDTVFMLDLQQPRCAHPSAGPSALPESPATDTETNPFPLPPSNPGGPAAAVMASQTRSCAAVFRDVVHSQSWYAQLRHVQLSVHTNLASLAAHMQQPGKYAGGQGVRMSARLTTDQALALRDVDLPTEFVVHLSRIGERLLHHAVQISPPSSQLALSVVVVAMDHSELPTDTLTNLTIRLGVESSCSAFQRFGQELLTLRLSPSTLLGQVFVPPQQPDSAFQPTQQPPVTAAGACATDGMRHLASTGHSFGSGFGISVLQKMITQASASVHTSPPNGQGGSAATGPLRQDGSINGLETATALTVDLSSTAVTLSRGSALQLNSSQCAVGDGIGVLPRLVSVSVHLPVRGIVTCEPEVAVPPLAVPLYDSTPVPAIAITPSSTVTEKQVDSNKAPLRVLVVEDNKLVQRVTTKLLVALGCEVVTADDGRLAIATPGLESFDIVFMDLIMPNMDGYEATEHIRRVMGIPPSKLPVVALTANAVEDERSRTLASGHFNDYVTKPAAKAKLASVLEQWVRQR